MKYELLKRFLRTELHFTRELTASLNPKNPISTFYAKRLKMPDVKDWSWTLLVFNPGNCSDRRTAFCEETTPLLKSRCAERQSSAQGIQNALCATGVCTKIQACWTTETAVPLLVLIALNSNRNAAMKWQDTVLVKKLLKIATKL